MDFHLKQSINHCSNERDFEPYCLMEILFNVEYFCNDLSSIFHDLKVFCLVASKCIGSCKVIEEQKVLFDVVLKAFNRKSSILHLLHKFVVDVFIPVFRTRS